MIHQLTQAGRTLVAVLLNCKSETLQHLIPAGLDALRSCVGLLRRFSGRYVCGLRSGDLMEEFCRRECPLHPSQISSCSTICSHANTPRNAPRKPAEQRHAPAVDQARAQETLVRFRSPPAAFKPESERGLAFAPRKQPGELLAGGFFRGYEARRVVRFDSALSRWDVVRGRV